MSCCWWLMTNGHLLWLTVICHLWEYVCPLSVARYARCIPILCELCFPHLEVCLPWGTCMFVVLGSLRSLYLNSFGVLIPILSNIALGQKKCMYHRPMLYVMLLSLALFVLCLVLVHTSFLQNPKITLDIFCWLHLVYETPNDLHLSNHQEEPPKTMHVNK